MPSRPSRNVVGKYLEFPPKLAEALQKFAKARKQTFRSVVMDACQRHLSFPPPVPQPVPDPANEPFPDVTPATNRPTPSREKGGAP